MMRIPCLHFFVAGRLCQMGRNCRFSHDRSTVVTAEWDRLQAEHGDNGALQDASSAPTTDETSDAIRPISTVLEVGTNDGHAIPGAVLMQVPSQHVGLVIGPKGATINRLRRESSANIDLEDDDAWKQRGAPSTRTVCLLGRPEQILCAQRAIEDLLASHTAPASIEMRVRPEPGSASLAMKSKWKVPLLPMLPLQIATPDPVTTESQQSVESSVEESGLPVENAESDEFWW
jgi:hypothetical protein